MELLRGQVEATVFTIAGICRRQQHSFPFVLFCLISLLFIITGKVPTGGLKPPRGFPFHW